MKKIFVLLLSFVLFFNANSQTKRAEISFNKETHNYGSFKEELGPQSFTFIFKNTGNAPLNLTSVEASCGCTTPKWTKSPVAPGKTGNIIVTFDPHNRPGPFNKSITVKSNAKTPIKVLKINGSVIPKVKTENDLYPEEIMGLRLKSKHIAFTKIYTNSTKKTQLEVYNASNKTIKIEFINIPKHLKIWAEPKILKPKQKGKIIGIYNSKIKNDYGFVTDIINLKINGISNNRTRITISASIEENFSNLTPTQLAKAPIITIDNKTYNFGTIKQGEIKKHNFILKNTGKSNLIIRKIKTNCGCTIAKLDKKIIKPGESINIRTSFNSKGRTGKQNKKT